MLLSITQVKNLDHEILVKSGNLPYKKLLEEVHQLRYYFTLL